MIAQLKDFAQTLGFQDLGITDTHLPEAKERLKTWLALGYNGEMEYMARYGLDRADPAAIVPETRSVIVVRMNYLPPDPEFHPVLNAPSKAFISRYAQNRDYHKLMRKRLQTLASFILEQAPHDASLPPTFRPFVDSGPIMEKPLAVKAGLGWIAKNTMLIHPKAGSFFFLGTLLTNLPFEATTPSPTSHCGRCTACIEICPTSAIVAPYQLDARRCLSYLTIEQKGPIPLEFRKALGNRIYGCDDCQIICPWNKFAKTATEIGFHATRGLLNPDLLTLFSWTEAMFLKKTEGSPIRRIGYTAWLRNLAVALGNAPSSPAIQQALSARLAEPALSPLVKEHIQWALQMQSL